MHTPFHFTSSWMMLLENIVEKEIQMCNQPKLGVLLLWLKAEHAFATDWSEERQIERTVQELCLRQELLERRKDSGTLSSKSWLYLWLEFLVWASFIT